MRQEIPSAQRSSDIARVNGAKYGYENNRTIRAFISATKTGE